MDTNSTAYGKSKQEASTSNSIIPPQEASSSLCLVDQSRKADSHVDNIETQEEEFDFRLWGGPFWKNSEMCAADEVFFQGQILPLLLQPNKDQTRLKRCQSKSDNSNIELHYSLCTESRSNSSKSSSSLISQNSSNSTNFTTTPKVSKSTSRNRFHTHPSPKPQPIPRQASVETRKSSMWDFFRLGVVPAPKIELQDLKVRRSTSNSSSNSGTAKSTSTHYRDKSNHGLFLSGCKCSIETKPLNTVVINSGTKSTNIKTQSETRAVKEKVVLELKKQRQRQKQGKKDMSRRRTFEWLKELSHASYLPEEEETLILNS